MSPAPTGMPLTIAMVVIAGSIEPACAAMFGDGSSPPKTRTLQPDTLRHVVEVSLNTWRVFGSVNMNRSLPASIAATQPVSEIGVSADGGGG
jgi:hypothetical protein